MAERYSVLKCGSCGNIVESLISGSGVMACCGQNMAILAENSVDAAKEKHVPAIEKIPGGYKVTIGSVAHPMEDKHYIEWIELVADGLSLTKFLKPGDQPVAEFKTEATNVKVREHCNLHGLWKAEA